ncbi:MAG: MFS transporter, partial [Streptosporangiaceae bacterium]
MTALQARRAPGSDTRRWWALVAIAASVLVVGLDLTILNLALPVLSTQLHASTTDLQWFSASYSLVLAAALLPAGLLGDRLGRKKMLLIALVVFGASSAACAFATSPAELIAARAVLGLGAAVILPMSIAVLPVLFAPQEWARAIAVVMGATFIAFPVGPLLGGWLLDTFWWGSVFLINVPVVVIALVAVALLMPESHGARSRRIGIPGIILSSLGLAGLTYGCIRAGENGWGDPAALATILGGAAVVAVFVAWERQAGRRRTALVQLEL